MQDPSGSTVKAIAASFALTGFTAALAVGWAAGNAATTILTRAIMVMAAAWLIGQIIATIARHAVDREVETYKDRNPLPDVPNESQDPANPQTPLETTSHAVTATQSKP